MNQKARAKQFAEMHRKDDPIILFNAWDAGSARAVAESGARAIATGSWSVAASHGFEDGEALPLELVIANLQRVVRVVDLPVTLDFEGGYSADTTVLCENIGKVLGAGAVGVNFEDQVVGGEGLYDIGTQRKRISAIRSVADDHEFPLFINARTDIFLKADSQAHDEGMLEEAIARSEAYSDAGASGFFAPGLRDEDKIRALCAASSLPVNILMYPDSPPAKVLAACGVARISYGPFPYIRAMEALTAAARQALSD